MCYDRNKIRRLIFRLIPVNYLEDGDKVEKQVMGLHIYCYRGRPKYLIHLWQTVLVRLSTCSLFSQLSIRLTHYYFLVCEIIRFNLFISTECLNFFFTFFLLLPRLFHIISVISN